MIVDEGSRIMVRDRMHKEKVSLQSELQLAEALSQRALACDVMKYIVLPQHYGPLAPAPVEPSCRATATSLQ